MVELNCSGSGESLVLVNWIMGGASLEMCGTCDHYCKQLPLAKVWKLQGGPIHANYAGQINIDMK